MEKVGRLNRAIKTCLSTQKNLALLPRGGGSSHMKGAGMLVFLLRMTMMIFDDVNFGCWSHLGCSGQNALIFSCQGLV